MTRKHASLRDFDHYDYYYQHYPLGFALVLEHSTTLIIVKIVPLLTSPLWFMLFSSAITDNGRKKQKKSDERSSSI